MQSFVRIAVKETPRLGLRVDRHELADVCRSAVLGFVTGVGEGWGPLELARWLSGTYRGVAVRIPREEGPPSSHPLRVDRDLLQARMHEARARVVAQLRALREPEPGMHFTMQASIEGWVDQFLDRTGHCGFAPVDHPRMRLADRVLSLVAADYLVRPESYQQDLLVCDDCDAVQFAWDDPSSRSCGACARASGVEWHARVSAA